MVRPQKPQKDRRSSRLKNRWKTRHKWKPRKEKVSGRREETFVVVGLDQENTRPRHTSEF